MTAAVLARCWPCALLPLVRCALARARCCPLLHARATVIALAALSAVLWLSCSLSLGHRPRWPALLWRSCSCGCWGLGPSRRWLVNGVAMWSRC